MVWRARLLVSGLLAALLLAGCEATSAAHDPPGEPQSLNGGVVTFTIGQHRFVMAAFAPPANLVLLRTGSLFFWASPNPALRHVYLEDVVNGRPAGSNVLEINHNGSMDYSYALIWRM